MAVELTPARGLAAGQPLTLRQIARLPMRERLRQPLYWSWLRFMVFGRAVPATLFAWFGSLQIAHARAAIAGLPAHPSVWVAMAGAMPPLLYVAFCTIPVGIYLTRPMPVARDGRLIARSAAFVGTTMQLFVGSWAPLHVLLFQPPVWFGDVCAALSMAALSWAVFSMGHLRRNLSIIPEARKLTTTGPYRLVRHPLYLAEITAAVALVLVSPYLVPTLALGAFIFVQTVRMGFEERLLRATFPEYAAYARRTARLVPNVW